MTDPQERARVDESILQGYFMVCWRENVATFGMFRELAKHWSYGVIPNANTRVACGVLLMDSYCGQNALVLSLRRALRRSEDQQKMPLDVWIQARLTDYCAKLGCRIPRVLGHPPSTG